MYAGNGVHIHHEGAVALCKTLVREQFGGNFRKDAGYLNLAAVG
jgi:hypothetical protein